MLNAIALNRASPGLHERIQSAIKAKEAEIKARQDAALGHPPKRKPEPPLLTPEPVAEIDRDPDFVGYYPGETIDERGRRLYGVDW